jgi:hypothetical protein
LKIQCQQHTIIINNNINKINKINKHQLTSTHINSDKQQQQLTQVLTDNTTTTTNNNNNNKTTTKQTNDVIECLQADTKSFEVKIIDYVKNTLGKEVMGWEELVFKTGAASSTPSVIVDSWVCALHQTGSCSL